MISIEELKKYISVFEESQLQTLELEDEDGRILMEKPQPEEIVQQVVAPAKAVEPKPVVDAPVEVKVGKTINSPMMGVFYSASSPECEPFVSVGKKVNKGDVVCIVEAMKIMNEISAEESGTVVEVLVNNGDVVEYGQPLFRLN